MCFIKRESSNDCDCIIFVMFCQQPNGQFQEDAINHCKSLGGSLAVLDNDISTQAVHNYIVARRLYEDWCIPNKGFWIGMDDLDFEGQYVWSDNTGLCDHFSNWASTEPNNNDKLSDGAAGKDCIQLW